MQCSNSGGGFFCFLFSQVKVWPSHEKRKGEKGIKDGKARLRESPTTEQNIENILYLVSNFNNVPVFCIDEMIVAHLALCLIPSIFLVISTLTQTQGQLESPGDETTHHNLPQKNPPGGGFNSEKKNIFPWEAKSFKRCEQRMLQGGRKELKVAIKKEKETRNTSVISPHFCGGEERSAVFFVQEFSPFFFFGKSDEGLGKIFFWDKAEKPHFCRQKKKGGGRRRCNNWNRAPG